MKNWLLFVPFAVFVLAACAGGSPASLQGQWKLVSYGSASDRKTAAAGVEASIEFKDGRVSGNVGCNGFGGEYTVAGGEITFDSVMSTMMFCEAVAEQESATLAVLQGLAGYALDGDLLTITSADGSMSIVLEKK